MDIKIKEVQDKPEKEAGLCIFTGQNDTDGVLQRI